MITPFLLSRNIGRLLGLILCALIGNFAEARFLEEDADLIENSSIGKEHESDKFSYSALSGLNNFHSTASYYFISAGSLSVNDFYLNESLSLKLGDPQKFLFTIEKHSKEDLRYQRNYYQYRFEWAAKDNIYLSVIGEPTANKEFSDIGIGLRVNDNTVGEFRLDLLSVDHTYNQKVSALGVGPDGIETTNKMTRQPASIEFKWTNLIANQRSFSLEIKADRPMRWWRYDLGYRYDQWQQSTLIKYDEYLDGGSVNFEVETWQLNESKHEWANSSCPTTSSKYQYKRGEISHKNTTPDSSISFYRRTGIRFIGNSQSVLCDNLDLSELGIEKQLMPFVQIVSPFQPNSWRYHIGGMLSLISDKIKSKATYLEAKAQIGWSWDFTYPSKKNLQVAINSAWDLDYLVTAFPYQNKRFLPWDGGNVQVSSVF